MKTVIVIISGLADLPDRSLTGKTPLMLAHTPALDALAKCGCAGSLRVCPDGVAPTRNNAILSLLGYDFSKGTPATEALASFGRSSSPAPEEFGLRCHVIPKFSGHGVMISNHPEVRGIGKMAMLRAIEGGHVAEKKGSDLCSLSDKVLAAVKDNELVVVHVESAAAMSRRHDPEGKQSVIEEIDHHIIAPIADYVWHAPEQMNMVVVSDNVFPWRVGYPIEGDVPAVVYFNDDLPYDTDRFDEETLAEGPLNAPLPGDLLKLLISFEPVFEK